MNKLKKIAAGVLLAASLSPVQATILTFDDITTTTNYAQLSTDYGGFNWGANWYVESDRAYANYGNSYGSTSGEYAAFNGYGVLSVALNSGANFDFNGASFTGWAINNSYQSLTATSVTVQGYNNGSLVGTASMNLSADKYDWLSTNLLGVDELRFISSNSDQWWLMDDFTFNQTTVVPEPGSLALMCLGLVGLGYVRLRKSASKRFVS